MSQQRVLDGRYEVGELIGRGGMADVHLGRDVRLGRSVAIKLLRPDLARDPQFQSRFRREAQAVAGLNHPSIVSVFDTGDQCVVDDVTEPVTVPFIVMEYVAGRTLRDLVRSKELSIDEAIEHTLGVLSALEYSHRAGIVHRDIKPANVMVTPDGGVKVMDFGIARAIADSAATMTQTQAVIGTAQYLSPEQARGETVDARSDLYSAACLLYEMLTSRPPFVGDSPVSVAYQHVREVPEPPSRFNPEVSSALDGVMLRALQKGRQERFQDAAAFRRALRAARTGVALAPPAPTVPQQDTHATVVVPNVVAAAASAGSRTAETSVQNAGSTRTQAMPRPHDGDYGEKGYTVDPGPGTRAMTKVGTGGPITTGDAYDHHNGGPVDFDAGRDNTPPRRKRRGGWIAALVIALLVVLGVGGYFLYNTLTAEPPPPPLVKVPAVENMTEAEALSALNEQDLDWVTDRVESDGIEEGLAIGTSPEAGARVEVGSTVELLISTGPSTVVIPESLRGQSEATVRDRLGQMGLVGGITEATNSATVPKGALIATEPALGSTVPAESTVDLIISTGSVTMPQLTGIPVEDAKATLEDPAIDLPYRVEEEENPVVEPGLVTGQSIPDGTAVAQGTQVVITVAVEPEEEPAPEDDPSSDEESPDSSTSPSPSPEPTESTPPDDD
ncbi:MAG TPA: Stk1 family PASTA domain-containing Ser/Thr kinase [Arthrobacter sp.]|nr:Stk1 family PASTA domain-containing Ser/Thr kinase [Arthrobacter sp.]